MISKITRCNELKSLGYIEVVRSNNEPYNGKDMFFCPQAPSLYMLYFNGDRTLIQKIGKSGFRAELSTKIKSITDIQSLHHEIDNVICNQDETSFIGKMESSGCLVSILFSIGLIIFSVYIN